MSIAIRQMEDKDVEEVVSLEASSFLHPWPRKEVLYELHENPCALVYVAEEKGTIVGYIDFMITFDSATISRLAVAALTRKKGVGTLLLTRLLEICCAQKEEPVEWVTLEVRRSNEAALALYKKNGFREVTVKKGYYDDGEDAIYMIRSVIA
jgi:[ribosomal protein S18]-alanine N-acetyltransferase